MLLRPHLRIWRAKLKCLFRKLQHHKQEVLVKETMDFIEPGPEVNPFSELIERNRVLSILIEVPLVFVMYLVY